MDKDLGFSEVRYHKFPQHIRCGSRVEGVQEEDPGNKEPEKFGKCLLPLNTRPRTRTGYTMGPYTQRYSSCTTERYTFRTLHPIDKV